MSHSLGTFIRERRQELGLTQEALAERLGETVTQTDISRIETGRVGLPRRQRLEAIAAALEVSFGDLLARSGWMTEGDRLAAAVQHVETLAADDAGYPQGVADLAEIVADVQAMMGEVTRTIDQATQALATAALQLARPRVAGDGQAPLALPDGSGD